MWRTGLNRYGLESCTVESSCRERNEERNHDNADERQAPPWDQTNHNVSSFRLPHDNLRLNYTDHAPESNVAEQYIDPK